jgi:hypothetical protein
LLAVLLRALREEHLAELGLAQFGRLAGLTAAAAAAAAVCHTAAGSALLGSCLYELVAADTARTPMLL